MINQETVGKAFSASAMNHAQANALAAIKESGSRIQPGMSEREATNLIEQVLTGMAFERHWHPVKVRFGEATLKTFREISDPDRILNEHDIFFLDIGPVWEGHEGDAGDTFVVGGDADMHACAEAARNLWRDVAEHWRQADCSGQALYQFADRRAKDMGWVLNLEMKGHRVSEFPHAIHKPGKLADFADCPSTGLWILEIQIAHPKRPFGAFYEDILVADGLS